MPRRASRRSAASDVAYVGCGLVIGAGLALVVGSGVLLAAFPSLRETLRTLAVTPTLTPTRTITPSPTRAPTATSTPRPTATITPSPTATLTVYQAMIQDGELVVVGPLHEQDAIIRLYVAANRFLAASQVETQAMGELINGPGYGSPSNICGPLSIAILKDAGIISADLQAHDFWLLNARISEDRARLDAAFPSDRFEHDVITERLNRIDWSLARLFPGDFLYIPEGGGGNFDHMLVVSRVDRDGRAYSVTNFQTEDGYVIQETLLYDPLGQLEGIFNRWSARPDQNLGSTGFDGFELWRLRAS